MAKVTINTTELDKAVAAFITRIGATGKVLNHTASYTFNRSTRDASTVTVTLFADEELERFGEPKPPSTVDCFSNVNVYICSVCNKQHDPVYKFDCEPSTTVCRHTWETVKGDDTAHHECRIVGTHILHRCGGCRETDPESIPLLHDDELCDWTENLMCTCPCPNCRRDHGRD